MEIEGANAILKLVIFIQGAGSLALLVALLKFWNDRQKLKNLATASDQANSLSVETHRDGLTIQLLETAREEIEVLRLEIERQRANETHLAHFQTALDHLEAILLADNAAELHAAKRAARAFLNRMKRLAEARGTVTNEIQRIDSKLHLEERGEMPGHEGGDKPD